jgi:hypothetical protein
MEMSIGDVCVPIITLPMSLYMLVSGDHIGFEMNFEGSHRLGHCVEF